MKQIVHVNQQAIARNRRGANEPPIIARTYKGVEHAFEMELQLEACGAVIGKFVYRPHDPLPCGARLWLELETNVCRAIPCGPSPVAPSARTGASISTTALPG